MAPEDELTQEDFGSEHQGLFRVLSNGIYHLEDSVARERFAKGQHLAAFLSKLIIELGITPNLQNCLYCHRKLSQQGHLQLLFDQGGFVDGQCSNEEFVDGHLEAWQILGQSWQLPYGEVAKLSGTDTDHLPVLYHYLLAQTQINQEQVKTAPLVIWPLIVLSCYSYWPGLGSKSDNPFIEEFLSK